MLSQVTSPDTTEDSNNFDGSSGPSSGPSAECQPLALVDMDTAEYQPGCLCGWRFGQNVELRAEALAIAYARHDRQEP